jgi:hypothetical protein
MTAIKRTTGMVKMVNDKPGTIVKISYGMPYILISYPDGYKVFFYGEEAKQILSKAPDDVSDKDYILSIAKDF